MMAKRNLDRYNNDAMNVNLNYNERINKRKEV